MQKGHKMNGSVLIHGYHEDRQTDGWLMYNLAIYHHIIIDGLLIWHRPNKSLPSSWSQEIHQEIEVNLPIHNTKIKKQIKGFQENSQGTGIS